MSYLESYISVRSWITFCLKSHSCSRANTSSVLLRLCYYDNATLLPLLPFTLWQGYLMVSHQFPQIDIQILTSQVLFLDNSIIPLNSSHYQSLFSSSQLQCPAITNLKTAVPDALDWFIPMPSSCFSKLDLITFPLEDWSYSCINSSDLCGIVSVFSVYTIYETLIARTKLWFEIEVQCAFDLGMSPTVFHTSWDALLNCTSYWCESNTCAAEITIQSLNFCFSSG